MRQQDSAADNADIGLRAGSVKDAATAGATLTTSIWQLAWPSMSAFALQAIVGFVDMLFVAQLGTDAVASVGMGSQAHFMVFAVMAAVTTGTVALVARAIGAGDELEAAKVLQVSLLLVGGLGLAFSAAAPLAVEVIELFGTSEQVTQGGGAYLAILLLASVPFGLGITLASGMRGAGDVRTPLLVGAAINVVNVLGDYTLIFGHFGAPALGASGSAVASAIAFTSGTALYLVLWRKNLLMLKPLPWGSGLTATRCRRILRIGLPTALEHLAFNLGLLLFLRIVAGFGTEGVAAYMIGVRILAFSFIPGLGFATAAATLVGQQLGARDPNAAALAGWRATRGAMAVMSCVGLAIVLFAEPISSAFGATGTVTTGLSVSFIYILGAAQPLMAMEFALGGALRGAGDTRFPLVAMSTGLFVFRLGGALAVMQLIPDSVVAVWCCLLADYAVKAALLTERFRRGRWLAIQL